MIPYHEQTLKEKIQTLVKISFFAAMLILPLYYKFNGMITPYIVGFIMATCLLGYMFLFPSTNALIVLDKVFGYSKSSAYIMQEEGRKNESKQNKIKNKRKVKFKK